MPKKFLFRLEPLLKLRANAVEQAKNALSTAFKNRSQKEEELLKKHLYFDELFTIENHGIVPARDLESQWHHQQLVQLEIRTLESSLLQLLEIEDLKRSELAEVMKQEKIVHKLKERKRVEYKEIVAKEEQMFLDEVGSRRKVR